MSALFFARPAAAGDKEEAKALFDKGVEQMEAGRYDQACPAIAKSYRLDPYPGTLFTLAECEAQRGRIATAVARYDEYLALYATLSPDKKLKQGTRQKESLAQKAALGPQVPELTLVLPPNAPSGTVVKRDGAEMAPAALGVPLALDPGEHVVTTQAPGGPVTEVKVTLGKGEKQTITLEVKRAPDVRPAVAATAEAPAGAPGPSGRRVGAYVAGGVGGAGLVVGAVAGGLMLAKKGVVTDNCKDGGAGVALCNHEGAVAGNSAKTLGLVASIGYGVAIAGVGTATILWLTEPSAPKAVTGQSALLRSTNPRWIRAGALAVGREGAMLGVLGVW